MGSYLQFSITRQGLDYIRRMVQDLVKDDDLDLQEAFMIASRHNAKWNWARDGYAWFMITPRFSKSGGYECVGLEENVHYRVKE